MALSDKLYEALNEQMMAEAASAYLYLSMAGHLEATSMRGMAGWMYAQVQEEFAHAMKFHHYLMERGHTPTLGEIPKPQASWDGPLALFEAVLAHEQHVTRLINEVVTVAQAENDRATVLFLDWFVSEQVEEEATATDLVDRLKLYLAHPAGVILFDRELGAERSASLLPAPTAE
jgi:ferritin